MDYFIVVVTTLAGLAFHAWLFVRFRRWGDRDLALSMAGNDAGKRAWMLERLAEAQAQRVPRRQLAAWLEQRASEYPSAEPDAHRTI